jgi:hypothetical protein
MTLSSMHDERTWRTALIVGGAFLVAFVAFESVPLPEQSMATTGMMWTFHLSFFQEICYLNLCFLTRPSNHRSSLGCARRVARHVARALSVSAWREKIKANILPLPNEDFGRMNTR